MRLFACALSTVLLSGCSWMGYGNNGQQSGQQGYASQQDMRYGGGNAQYNPQTGQRAPSQRAPLSRCQISAPTQRIPQGCRSEDVTLALGGARQQGVQQYGGQYSQTSQGQYTSGGYGSHAGSASAANQAPQQRFRKPRLRGQIGLEIDHSVSGDLYQPGITGAVAAYNRALYQESSISGSIAAGQTTRTTYSSVAERIASPNISFDDVHTAPLRLTGGLEYIMGSHATLFANAGYTRAEGKKGGGTQMIDGLVKTEEISDYIIDAAAGVVGTLIGTNINSTVIPNQIVATFNYDFNELEKYDFEAGGRYYFNPILADKLQRSLTPFVSASAGAAHYNATTVNENQQQRFLSRAYEGQETSPTGDFYDVNFGARTQIYDAQWVPYGALKAGVEWQMSPKTALAFETGVKFEGARDFSDGSDGADNISVPVTIRGSYNF